MDDGSPIGYLILILALLLGGGYFAGTEIAFASVNRIRMMSYASGGDKRAKRVLYILDHFDKALTTLLIGNNIMHIGCASTATLMASKLWGVDAVTATTFVTTMVVFLVAEMLPKRFAKACNEPFALATAASLLLLMKLLTPVSFLFTKLGSLIKKPFHASQAEEPTVTEDELYDILETVGKEGAIDEEKTELVQNALEFSDIFVRDVLTPWDKVLTVRAGMSNEEILCLIRDHSHSRLPVLDTHGRVAGMLHIRKYLKAYLTLKPGRRLRLSDVTDQVHFVEASLPIDELLPVMSAMKAQIAVAVDDGDESNPLGIVTMEDILEELVGEIYDEDDQAAPEEAAQPLGPQEPERCQLKPSAGKEATQAAQGAPRNDQKQPQAHTVIRRPRPAALKAAPGQPASMEKEAAL